MQTLEGDTASRHDAPISSKSKKACQFRATNEVPRKILRAVLYPPVPEEFWFPEFVLTICSRDVVLVFEA